MRLLSLTSILIVSIAVALVQPAAGGNANTQFDVFFCLDVSASMAGKDKGSTAIFDEVRKRLYQDINARNIGDHVDITVFAGPPKVIASRTLAAEVDKEEHLLQPLRALVANGGSTYLYLAYMDVLKRAHKWALDNPSHFVEVRVYTDGVNQNAPARPSLADVTNRCAIVFGEVDNLLISQVHYPQPNETELQRKQREDAEEALSHWVRPATLADRFVRLAPLRIDLGLIRPYNYKKPFNILTYFPSELAGVNFEFEAVLDDKSYTVNCFPRPVQITDRAIQQTFEVVQQDDIAADSRRSFTGRFIIKTAERNIKFSPPAIRFKFSNEKVRTATWFIESVPQARAEGDELWIGLASQPTYTDIGLEPFELRLSVAEAHEWLDSDQVTLSIELPDAELKGYPVAGFVEDVPNAPPAMETTVTKATEELIIRIDYGTAHLKNIDKPGHYPVLIHLVPSSETVVTDIRARDHADARAPNTRIIRIFPGPIPDHAALTASQDGQILQSCIKIPPAAWLKWVLLLLEVLIVAIICRYVLRWKLGGTIVAAALWMLMTAVWGSWAGSCAILPDAARIPGGKVTLWVLWGVGLIWTFLPAPFARWPWWGGWMAEAGSTGSYSLRAASLGFFFGPPHPARNRLEIAFGKGRQPGMLILTPAGYVMVDDTEIEVLFDIVCGCTKWREVTVTANEPLLVSTQSGSAQKPLAPGESVFFDEPFVVEVNGTRIVFSH